MNRENPPPHLRKVNRIAWHRRGRPPLPELRRMIQHDFVEYHRIEEDLLFRRAKIQALYVAQLREGELVSLPGSYKNGIGTPRPGRHIHTDVDLRYFAFDRRISTGNGWLIRGDLGLDEEDNDALYDLKIRREAHARILASRAHPAAPESAGVLLPEPRRAPPQRWISLQEIVERPSRLLPGDLETREHPLDDAILKEIFRAAPAGQIRHELLLSGYQNTLEGLLRDPIDERLLLAPEHWDLVDRERGVLEHPPGTSRVINLCLEDAQAHFRAWLQKRSSTTSEAAQDQQVGAGEPGAAASLPTAELEQHAVPEDAPSATAAASTAWHYDSADYIDMKGERPVLKKFNAGTLEADGLHRATETERGECFRTLAHLAGGQTNRDHIRVWGRYWLRTHRHADYPVTALTAEFLEKVDYKSLHRPEGNPNLKPAG
jgi:hypothetical protein